MENPVTRMEKSALLVVAIDGNKIKTIRETKKLTQLYVASVVGVTTDTISRWENNRYPAIKRDNAEKLASALEVTLAEILRQEDSEQSGEIYSPPARRYRSRSVLFIMILISLLLAGVGVFFSRQFIAIPLSERKLPAYGAPGTIVPVQVRITRAGSSTSGIIVKEHLPAGWRLVTSVPPAATGQADAEEIKWLIPSEAGEASISYTVRIPQAAVVKTTAAFTGEVVAAIDGITRKGPSGGDRAMTVAGVHWADRNGDGRIDDDEIMPAYYLTEIKGLGLDWKQIESVWSGKGYRWDPLANDFVVLK